MPINHESRIFWITAIARFGLFLAVLLSGAIGTASRDTNDFHREAIHISELYSLGLNDWSKWIDDAWPQFVGLIYFVVAHSFVPVMLVNAALAGFAAVFLYRIACAASGDSAVAAACGYTFALFPSAIWFHAMPIKECAAAFAVLSILGGIMEIRMFQRRSGWLWILVGLIILAGLRIYLVPVLSIVVAACVVPIRLPRNLLGLIGGLVCLGLFGVVFFFTISLAGINISEYEALQYFDIDRLNQTRVSLSRGSGRMYGGSGEQAAWGRDPLNDVILGVKAIWFSLAGIDFTNLRSDRQIMAIPEAIAVLYSLPCLIVGAARLWRDNVRAAMPILIITLTIVAVYGAGTTNMGAMYRWRLQALPGVIVLVYYGAACRQKSIFYSIICLFRGDAVDVPQRASRMGA